MRFSRMSVCALRSEAISCKSSDCIPHSHTHWRIVCQQFWRQSGVVPQDAGGVYNIHRSHNTVQRYHLVLVRGETTSACCCCFCASSSTSFGGVWHTDPVAQHNRPRIIQRAIVQTCNRRLLVLQRARAFSQSYDAYHTVVICGRSAARLVVRDSMHSDTRARDGVKRRCRHRCQRQRVNRVLFRRRHTVCDAQMYACARARACLCLFARGAAHG